MKHKREHLRSVKQRFGKDYPEGCLKCQLFMDCMNYKIPARQLQAGKKKVLIIAECPGEEEDAHNKILIGKSGNLLMDYIREYLPEWNVWATNAVKCCKKGYTIDKAHVRSCSDFLKHDIEKIKPDVIIAMGEVAKLSLEVLDDTINRGI